MGRYRGHNMMLHDVCKSSSVMGEAAACPMGKSGSWVANTCADSVETKGFEVATES